MIHMDSQASFLESGRVDCSDSEPEISKTDPSPGQN